jgi:hypothetical protein
VPTRLFPWAEVHAAGPVPLSDRLDELQAFQAWMDLAGTIRVKDKIVVSTPIVCEDFSGVNRTMPSSTLDREDSC